jgi:hypothetical protein
VSTHGGGAPPRHAPRRWPIVLAVLGLLAAAVVVVVVTAGGPTGPVQPVGPSRPASSRVLPVPPRADGGPFLAYSESSFLRRPLPADAPVDAESDRGITFAKTHDRSSYPLVRGVDGDNFGMPYAMSSCSDPLWRLTGTVPPELGFLTTEGFHAPSTFADHLTGSSDSPMVVIDRCGVPAMPRGLTVWAAKVSAAGTGTLDVGAAGAFQHDSNGLDRRDPMSDSSLNERSRGAIPDAMVIRDDLLTWGMQHDSGDLGQVLHMFWPETDSAAGAVHPMVAAEAGKQGFGAEGMRLRIRPDIDLGARQCSPAGLVVARTLQRYGAYLGDNAGGSASLKAEQGSGLIGRDALSCLSWDDFVFVQRGWDG